MPNLVRRTFLLQCPIYPRHYTGPVTHITRALYRGYGQPDAFETVISSRGRRGGRSTVRYQDGRISTVLQGDDQISGIPERLQRVSHVILGPWLIEEFQKQPRGVSLAHVVTRPGEPLPRRPRGVRFGPEVTDLSFFTANTFLEESAKHVIRVVNRVLVDGLLVGRRRLAEEGSDLTTTRPHPWYLR